MRTRDRRENNLISVGYAEPTCKTRKYAVQGNQGEKIERKHGISIIFIVLYGSLLMFDWLDLLV